MMQAVHWVATPPLQAEQGEVHCTQTLLSVSRYPAKHEVQIAGFELVQVAHMLPRVQGAQYQLTGVEAMAVR